MNQIKPQDIVNLLLPGTGQIAVFSIFLYIIFFFALITLLVMPNKNMLPTLLVATVLLFAVVAKLSVSAPRGQAIIANKDFGMFVINVGMFILPLIAIGMARARKNRAPVPAIITSLVAAVYFFAFWIMAQH